jgi:hypothetical protein
MPWVQTLVPQKKKKKKRSWKQFFLNRMKIDKVHWLVL